MTVRSRAGPRISQESKISASEGLLWRGAICFSLRMPKIWTNHTPINPNLSESFVFPKKHPGESTASDPSYFSISPSPKDAKDDRKGSKVVTLQWKLRPFCPKRLTSLSSPTCKVIPCGPPQLRQILPTCRDLLLHSWDCRRGHTLETHMSYAALHEFYCFLC